MIRRRTLAGLVAGILTISCASQIAATQPVHAADSYDMNISVNLNGEKKAISPYIYGVNEYGNTNNLRNVTAGAVRQGGNRYTGYNWETNYSNAGHDWINSSDTNIGDDSDGPGYAARRLSESCQKYNVPYKMTTLQMAGYVAADKAGTVEDVQAAPSSRWDKVEFQKNGELSLTPDTTDGTVYMDEYVNYLVQTLGNSATASGIQGYNLDNEPVLWNQTHPLIHAETVSNNELISKTIALSRVVKSIDPNAEVYGPAFWGILPCIQAGNSTEYTDPEWDAVKNDYTWYMDFYLKQMADAEETYGTRLLDAVDVHYYAQDCSTDEGILQAARSLYDPDYKEKSWLQPYFGQYFPFLTRMQESIEKYYPGTKLALTEYNLANISDEKNTGKSVVSAIAETEALGAFADQGVYLATYWGTLPECPYVESAFNLYTNYDGKGSAFGNTLVESKSEDLSKAAVFASIQGNDEGTVTATLSNKSSSSTENAVISLEGSSVDYQSAVVYAITKDSSDIKILDIQNDVNGNQVKVELPPLSVAQIVISDEKTDVTYPEEPDIRTEKVIYNWDDLELSENGFKMIPLGDKEHLKEIIINTTATSNAGSSWISGGGGLCFNHVIPSGETKEQWASKSFSYNAGTADAIIPFDELFSIVVDGKSKEVSAVCNDTYAELQDNWWKSSEKGGDKGTDVTVTFNSITLVYEYSGSSETTTTTIPETTTTTEEITTTTAVETSTTSKSSSSEAETTVTTTQTASETTVSSSDSAETTTTTTSQQTEPIDPIEATLCGDVNQDGEVSLADAVILNKAVAGQVNLNEQAKANADCKKDNILSSDDSMTLLQFLVHLVDNIPVA